MNKEFYSNYKSKQEQIKSILNRPLTYTEKILYSHLWDKIKELKKGEDYADVKPDRVAMQDATAQMAILQFMLANKKTTAVPTSVHCDHLIRARTNAADDLINASQENKEVYDFLESSSKKYGMDFWKPGSGIIHQVVLEEYAFPGGVMIGTDSHTPNAGGLGMVAIGVGGADAVDVMANMPLEIKWPKILGVKLTGKLSGWTSPKDVILRLLGILTAKGATGYIVEYFGEGAKGISCTGKATITNMGAELGATCSVFPFDYKMFEYLKKTNRIEVAKTALEHSEFLKADKEIYENPEKYFDKFIEIDLSELEPRLNGPFSPDKEWPISKLKHAIEDNDFPKKVSVALIGSCTNSSFEDIERCINIVNQALDNGVKAKIPFIITPGSEQIRATMEKMGYLELFEKFGGKVMANACGPCIGMWQRMDNPNNEKNAIVTSYNRNFAKRNDGNPKTLAFVASPEIVTAMAISGKLSFNPEKDEIISETGNFKLNPPKGDELPEKFEQGEKGVIISQPDETVDVIIHLESERIAKLKPFEPWNGLDYVDLPVLIKAKEKCTTDHISPAGPWLKYRGHLDNISKNMFIGAVNYFTDEVGKVKNILTQDYKAVHEVAREYKAENVGWVVFGEENYGEGSSREHAAMEPRFLGCKAVIVKSFARIHETNLKKQGVLALTFQDKEDYDKILEDDKIDMLVTDFQPGKPLKLVIKHNDETQDEIMLNHTYNQTQIEWFKAGSALNLEAKNN